MGAGYLRHTTVRHSRSRFCFGDPNHGVPLAFRSRQTLLHDALRFPFAAGAAQKFDEPCQPSPAPIFRVSLRISTTLTDRLNTWLDHDRLARPFALYARQFSDEISAYLSLRGILVFRADRVGR